MLVLDRSQFKEDFPQGDYSSVDLIISLYRMYAAQTSELINVGYGISCLFRKFDGISDDSGVNIKVSLVYISVCIAFVLHSCLVIEINTQRWVMVDFYDPGFTFLVD